MANLFNRSNFIKTVNGEKDFLLNSFSKFVWKRPFKNYRLVYEDYMRPDLISQKNYGTIDYWWIILLVNPTIEDIWNDMAITIDQETDYPTALIPGEMISIPSILDIQDFYSFNKKQ